MMTIVFTIADEIGLRFPHLSVHAMRVRGLNAAICHLDTSALLREVVSSITVDDGAISEDKVIAAWRQAYAALGVKPSKYQSSIEALRRRALKGSLFVTGIGSVDLYNSCSLAAGAPLGAYDLARLPPHPLALRLARPGLDRFEPLGAEASSFPLTESLAVYASGDSVLCWGFNVRDCRQAALTANTEEAIFFSEAVNPDQATRSKAALTSLGWQLRSAGADCSPIEVATPSSPELLIF